MIVKVILSPERKTHEYIVSGKRQCGKTGYISIDVFGKNVPLLYDENN